MGKAGKRKEMVQIGVEQFVCGRVSVSKWKSMSPSTTPATWNEGGCLQVPRLPRQQPRRPGVPLRPKRATGASPVPYVPRLPRKSGSRCHQVPRLPRLPSFLPSFLSSFPPFLLPSFPSSLLTSLLPFCRPSFPPFLLYGHLFFFDASPDQVSQSGAAGAAAVLTSIEGMHPRSEESWWGRWRFSLILQDCRFFDSPWLAFAAPPGCCPGCSYLSQGRSSGWSISFSTSSWA